MKPVKTSDLRIISGKYRGQKLRSPESALTHPMGSREKLALFNLLQPYLVAGGTHDADIADTADATDVTNGSISAGPKVLDLYAGSGALGIEALSRGAREVVFVEKSPRVARLISDNLASLRAQNPSNPKNPDNPGNPGAFKVFSESVAAFCQRPEYLSYFDIIIADPPYDNFHPEDLANISQILSKNGVFVLSSPAKTDSPALLGGLQQETTRTYAAARLTVYSL